MNKLQIRNKGVGVESYFVKIIHPVFHKGIWLKFTFLKKSGSVWKDDITLKVWATLFGHGGPTRTTSEVYHINRAQIDQCQIRWPDGFISFAEGSEGKVGDISWDLEWKALDDQPIKLLPDFLYSNLIPTTKLVTPFPKLEVTGLVKNGCLPFMWRGEKLIGMQGHNWGPKHSREYVWLFGYFNEGIVEGFSTTIPPFKFTSVCMRDKSGKDHLFSDVLSPFRIKSYYKAPMFYWDVQAKNFHLTAHGTSSFAKLAYQNPDGSNMYCHNDNTTSTAFNLFKDGADRIVGTSSNVSLEFLTKKPLER